jgi:DNA-binding response OmpR family regulator
MALIVVCEDDASTRTLITAVLTKAGHHVEAFDNGMMGFARMLEGDVELLISDVQMPGKDGFTLIADVREDKQLMEIPCILLTSLLERAHMRIGMTSGADDYVTKPFQPVELIEAVNSQLKRAMQLHILHVDETLRSVDAAVGQRTNELMEIYEKRLQRELQSRWERSHTSSTELRGSLLGCTILQQDAWLQVLSNAQMADMARHFFNKVADCAALFSAEHLQFVGDGLLIVFDAGKDTSSVHHASRAHKLMQSMSTVRSSMQTYVREQFAHVAATQSLPNFNCSLVVHEGHLSLGKLDGVTGGIDQLVPVGQDVQLVSMLLKAAQMLGWQLAFSNAALNHWVMQGMSPSIIEQREAKFGAQALRIHRGE